MIVFNVKSKCTKVSLLVIDISSIIKTFNAECNITTMISGAAFSVDVIRRTDG